ncbi:MAG TPA: hypothetical protein DD723_06810 [Candidatus Omnitrophica bacterium]|uniref:DUF2231 domain-containing protein n=1 Tax=Candidatus Kaiserbacteria bacterium GW2011_GWA2_49_19 TaxID=1618669 RepID=A0A0G1Y1X2_9BACT|nr:MAG: hypothetical protein UY44_C0006G0002 [Candidatus Kaiserbacteria bacterium GW2011_GWA2_49_19]HBR15235.1 hypothetical protein [Candidatus Omnitrophota bacterium]
MLDYLIPLHPKVVHFPIALFTTAIVFDVLGFIFRKEDLHKTAEHIYVFAALLTPIVVRTGLWEEERLHLSHPVLDKHRMFALWTMWVSLMSLPVLWFVKKELSRYCRVMFPIFLLVVVTCVTMAGHNGGRMVYEYGAGIEE